MYKRQHLPWYLLAAKALAANGVRIFMHGGGAHTAGRLYSEQLLTELDIPCCRDWQGVATALDQHGLAYSYLGDWMPALQRMIDLRNTLGLRSPIHSLARIIKMCIRDRAITLAFSGLVAFLSQRANVPYPNFFVVLIGFYGLFFLTYKLRDSAWGLVSTLALTGFMGYTLGPILNLSLIHI